MRRCLVTYDISDDRRRKMLGDLLEGYGKRVQRSVFEIELKNERHLETLKARVLLQIDPAEDSVRLYQLCQTCVSKAVAFGDEPEPFERDAIYFF